MAENKTQPSATSASEFIASIENPTRRADAETMLAVMQRITGWQPRMWGPSIIGFGEYHYQYESGREGDFMRTGFSPRKANLVLYIMPGYADYSDKLARLGKHKIGKSCLYINKLADVDMAVLEEIIEAGLDDMARKYPL
ncbi:hypothetical protein AWH62_14145 [Maricaulis sp. W15]|uniref:DUF1801 domain-containing protein n=1 Tax=Maricaulis sp. W15 TaxID=1772333 RepID=UPI000948944F|nr:DUF1801 domain-containing protein [Maricaulis sp. W15]OLF80856.1 hypothetical protein AWH62_14145 [Maricaulis sp. W15]